MPTDRAADLRRAVRGLATDADLAALAASRIVAGRPYLDLPMDGTEITACPLVTVKGVEAHEPPKLRAEFWA